MWVVLVSSLVPAPSKARRELLLKHLRLQRCPRPRASYFLPRDRFSHLESGMESVRWFAIPALGFSRNLNTMQENAGSATVQSGLPLTEFVYNPVVFLSPKTLHYSHWVARRSKGSASRSVLVASLPGSSSTAQSHERFLSCGLSFMLPPFKYTHDRGLLAFIFCSSIYHRVPQPQSWWLNPHQSCKSSESRCPMESYCAP